MISFDRSSRYTASRAIARFVPSKKTFGELAALLGVPEPRLAALRAGDRMTPEEAEAFAAQFGGEPEDYRPFLPAEDSWLMAQPVEIQAQVARLVAATLQEPGKAAAAAQSFARKSAWAGLAAVLMLVFSVGHFGWLELRYRQLKKEAYLWVGNVYADRDIAVATAGIEECRSNINRAAHFSDLVDKAWSDPSVRGDAQRVLLDGTRYYRAIAAQYAERIATTRQARKRQVIDNVLIDPFSDQPVNVEDPKGGGLDMSKVQEMIRLQIRSAQYLGMLEEVSTGRKAPSSVPPIEKWGEMAIQGGGQ